MSTTLIGKEFVSRLQGKLTYFGLSLIVTLFTGLVLAAFWMLILNVPTVVPVIGQSTTTSPGVTIQSLVAGNRGAFLFYALFICVLAAIFSVAPAVASSAISSERENDTFDLLLLGGLRARSIVIGKLMAAVLFVLLLMSTVLPGFAIAWMFGGVSFRDAALTTGVALATVVFVCCVGLLFSAVARTSTLAALYTYSAVYFLSLGSLMAYLIGASVQQEAIVRPLLSLNPFVALLTIPETLVSGLQQTLPFQYRTSLDATTHELLGLSVRYSGWLNTLALYLGTSVLLVLAACVAIDPCHRWRSRARPEQA
jgi:ABC-type transport system involved in multi-copper enzyme maturation permease subunit